jgi:hypothetical protein
VQAAGQEVKKRILKRKCENVKRDGHEDSDQNFLASSMLKKKWIESCSKCINDNFDKMKEASEGNDLTCTKKLIANLPLVCSEMILHLHEASKAYSQDSVTSSPQVKSGKKVNQSGNAFF